MNEPNPISAFFAMGGYAAYVWPAYAIALAILTGMAVQTVRKQRQAKDRLDALERGDAQP